MKQIEATYLRYIFDGLSLNTIHKDNIPALSEGLIGMNDEALLNEQSHPKWKCLLVANKNEVGM